MRDDTFFQVIASSSLQSEQEQRDGRGYGDPSHCADDEPLGGERGHDRGAGRVGYPVSSLTEQTWLSYRNIGHIFAYFETQASRQCAPQGLHILLEN